MNPRRTVSGGVTTSTTCDRDAISAAEEGKMAWMSGNTGSIACEGGRDIEAALELLLVVAMLGCTFPAGMGGLSRDEIGVRG